ncbi:MAG: hypothetical protein ABI678_02995 [Kofleriaceae bacterium]
MLPELATLEQVLAWTFAQRGELVEVVVQDEYSHDVIVHARAGDVVFDTT